MTSTAKIAFAAIGVAMSLMFLGLSAVEARERRRLLREGQRSPGRVTAIEREGPSCLPRLTLHYEYQPPGHARPIPRRCRVPAGAPSYSVGDEVVVCFNPASPATSVMLSPRGEPWTW